MANTTVYFVRHPKFENPDKLFHRDTYSFAPTAEGILQAQDLGQKIATQGGLDIIYTTPYKRGLAAAEEISKICDNAPVIICNELQEVHSIGGSGQPRSMLEGNYYAVQPQGLVIESPQQQVERTMNVVHAIQRTYEGGRAAIVGHCDPLAFTMWQLLHPDQELPSIEELYRNGQYLDKGSAWKVTLDAENTVLHQELLRGEAIGIRRERE